MPKDPRQRARKPLSMFRSNRKRPPSTRDAWTFLKTLSNPPASMMWLRLSKVEMTQLNCGGGWKERASAWRKLVDGAFPRANRSIPFDASMPIMEKPRFPSAVASRPEPREIQDATAGGQAGKQQLLHYREHAGIEFVPPSAGRRTRQSRHSPTGGLPVSSSHLRTQGVHPSAPVTLTTMET